MSQGSSGPDASDYLLGDFFTIKRGIETGGNDFFILSSMEAAILNIPSRFLRPILPGPTSLDDGEVVADPEGWPILEDRFVLLDVRISESDVRRHYPSVWRYLESGIERGVDKSYSCRHRSPWYLQERRPPAPYLCGWLGSHSEEATAPLIFVLNHSRATAPNLWLLMYPKPALARQIGNDYGQSVTVWGALNAIGNDEMARGRRIATDRSRLDPGELASVPADRIVTLYPTLVPDSRAQLNLFDA
jgi:hypothetical protein